MTIVADTGGIYALYDASDRHHLAVREVLEAHRGPIVVPLPVVAEVDYFLLEYLGRRAALDFIESLTTGAFALDHLSPGDVERCYAVRRKSAERSSRCHPRTLALSS